MSCPFTLDGVTYNVRVPREGIKRSGQVLDGDAAGRSANTAAMIRDIKGTFYNYSITIDTNETAPAEYDRLYNILTAPEDYHTLKVPYGQGTMTFKAYVTSAEDTLISMENGVNIWGGLTVNFIATAPARTP